VGCCRCGCSGTVAVAADVSALSACLQATQRDVSSSLSRSTTQALPPPASSAGPSLSVPHPICLPPTFSVCRAHSFSVSLGRAGVHVPRRGHPLHDGDGGPPPHRRGHLAQGQHHHGQDRSRGRRRCVRCRVAARACACVCLRVSTCVWLGVGSGCGCVMPCSSVRVMLCSSVCVGVWGQGMNRARAACAKLWRVCGWVMSCGRLSCRAPKVAAACRPLPPPFDPSFNLLRC